MKCESSLKRLLSMIVVFAMIVTMLPLSIFAADDVTLYLVPNTNWLKDNARFAIYYWNDSGNNWTSMSDADGDGMYEGTIPSGYTNVIFCRMNPGSSTNNWNNKWNQTGDLTYDGTNNCYTVKAGTWDKGGGTWSIHNPTYTVTFNGTNVTSNGADTVTKGEDYTATLTADDGYELPETITVTGANGHGYDSATGELTIKAADITGDITITAEGVEKANYLYLKPNSNWTQANARFAIYYWDGNGSHWADMTDSDGDGIYEVELPEGYSNIIFCRMNPNSSTNDWNNKWNQTADLTIPADGKNLFTVPSGSWDGATTTWSVFEPTTEEPDDGGEEEPSNDYYLVGYINNADYSGNDYKFVDGQLTVTFSADSYVVVKDQTGDWYMTASYCQETSGTFVKGNSEKMFVPGNVELTFTLVENSDGSLTMSYEKKAEEEEPTR